MGIQIVQKRCLCICHKVQINCKRCSQSSRIGASKLWTTRKIPNFLSIWLYFVFENWFPFLNVDFCSQTLHFKRSAGTNTPILRIAGNIQGEKVIMRSFLPITSSSPYSNYGHHAPTPHLPPPPIAPPPDKNYPSSSWTATSTPNPQPLQLPPPPAYPHSGKMICPPFFKITCTVSLGY